MQTACAVCMQFLKEIKQEILRRDILLFAVVKTGGHYEGKKRSG